MSGLEALLYWSSLVLYAGATASYLYALAFSKPRWILRAAGFACGAFGLHSVSVIWRMAATGHVPVKGTFENTLTGAWFIVLFTLLITFRNARFRSIGLGAIPFALLLLGFGAVQPAGHESLTPPFQSVWLYIHVFFAWLSYGAYTVACGSAICFLIRDRADRRGVASRVADLLPEADWLDEYTFRLILLGFIASAVMIVAGSFWANSLWGTYWGWDPVETWSLISWLTYGLAIHLRVTWRWRGRKSAWLAVGAIVFVLVSFWGVNYLTGTTHSFDNL